MNKVLFIIIYICVFSSSLIIGQDHSVARKWNEVLLEAVRNDYARPTIHARNLFHVSAAMYDAWAAFDETASNYLIKKPINFINTNFSDIEKNNAREEAISYAAYRLLNHRFKDSPGAEETQFLFDSLFTSMGYNNSDTSIDLSSGLPSALGNYIAHTIINFGLSDGSNEENGYSNLYYNPINQPLDLNFSGNPNLFDPNRWQPLSFTTFRDQSGHIIPNHTPEFLSPEWGIVKPFALEEDDLTIRTRDGFDYWIYHDPGPPPYIDTNNIEGMTDEYKWGFVLVAMWSSHLNPQNDAMIDISPGSIGNLNEYPESIENYSEFYELIEGGDQSVGHTVNPYTGKAYEPQMVPLGDYARVLAEFWADGPDSETPPGHWFTILNYVNDHPEMEKRYKGEGEVLDDLEWDVKSYFTLGGALHDAAISAWGVKGWYDYIRPISAIRSMADRGQCTDSNLTNFHPGGIPLVDGYVELVVEGDPLAGDSLQNVGKVKLFAWRGHSYIDSPIFQKAGVGWILAEDWWPYQRPSFVTPPFAGYVSGHSTYSRAAAEALTLLTGDEFFPGGMGEFYCKQNEFLVFEDGPSIDLTLQWATYKDASDQCALSRIWGGIHPPADDIAGRKMGISIGQDAFNYAEKIFNSSPTKIVSNESIIPSKNSLLQNYPNPFNPSTIIQYSLQREEFVSLKIFDILGNEIAVLVNEVKQPGTFKIEFTPKLFNASISSGVYFTIMKAGNFTSSNKMILMK